MRQETLAKMHHGYQGIQRCRLWVASSVWWPGVSNKIEQFVQSCLNTTTDTFAQRIFINYTTTKPPMRTFAADLFELKGSTYLLVTDYYSRFVEVQRLTTTISSSIVRHLKIIFVRFEIRSPIMDLKRNEGICSNL